MLGVFNRSFILHGIQYGSIYLREKRQMDILAVLALSVLFADKGSYS